MREWVQMFLPLVYGLAIYSAVAASYLRLTDGDLHDFWIVMAFLLVARFFFSVLDTVGGIFYWHFQGKEKATNWFFDLLAQNEFPKRFTNNESFLGYLSRIQDEPRVSETVKRVAYLMESRLADFEQTSILGGMRMHAASEAALEMYSPKSEAPTWSESDT